jgi:acyl carrier protein
MSLRETINQVFEEVFREQQPGKDLQSLRGESVLLESGLDSLGFAILVVRLEEVLGYDPFVLSAVAYYPRTFGDFVKFYEDNQPK